MEHLVRPDLRSANKSANLELNEKVKLMQKDGRQIFHLAFGQSPFPIPRCFVDALQKYAWKNDYLPVAGTLELRKAIAKWHQNHGENFDHEQIVVGTGSKELIYLIMTIFNGDVILISPGWTTYAPQTRLARQKCFVLNTTMKDQWKVTPQNLEAFIEANDISDNRLMILNNPGNPSGMAYTSEELCKLSQTCRKLNVTILSDEIYGLLNFAAQHHSISKWYPEGTLVTSGFSKWSSAGGWRIGYIILPANMTSLTTVLQSAASQTYSCAPAPMQHAIAEGLENKTELLEYIEMERRVLKAVGDFCHRELESVGVKGIPSQGGYYFMPDFEICRQALASRKGLHNGKEMCSLILQDFNVALLPGSDFLRDANELNVRLCFVDFDGGFAMDLLKNGHEINDGLVEKCAPRVVSGIQRLKAFVAEYT